MSKNNLCMFCSAIFFLIQSFVFPQQKEISNNLFEFANETKDYFEGFSASKGGNDFSYHSLRNDLTDCMLTRCTTGDMAVEWNTAPIKSEVKISGAGFVWIAALDIIPEKHLFDVYFNEVKRFQIISGTETSWELTTPDGGKLKYIGVEKDQHGDIHGYMSLFAPTGWLIPGKPQSIKIVGNADNSSCWIIVYKTADAQSYLQQSLKYDAWVNVKISKEEKDYRFEINVPPLFNGRKINLKTGGMSFEIDVQEAGHISFSDKSLNSINIENMPFGVYDEFGEMVYVNSFEKSGTSSMLVYNAIVQCEVEKINETVTEIKGIRNYKPKTVESLLNLAQSKLSDGKIYLMNSSHQDIAWMDSPEKCVLERDTMLLTPLYNKAIKDDSYRFDIEDALMLKEYIHRHPDRKEGIKLLLKNGQISCGSSYIQPYEEMYSGEALVRQFYFGTRWLKKEFDYSANTYWNLDVPGRTLQMPQILKKSGTNYLILSRMEKGVFRWYSPDDSYVTVYSPGHYSESFTALQKNIYDAAQYIAASSLPWSKYFISSSQPAAVPLFSDWDMSPAKDYSSIINWWNRTSEVRDKDGNFVPVKLPPIELSLTPNFIEEFEKNAGTIPSIKGERPAVWLYIHGPAHQKEIRASREGDIMLTIAEKFSTVNSLIDNSFVRYPEEALNKAWESKIYPDHGWGGKNGDITDNLFKEKYIYALSEAERIVESQLKDISSKIKFDSGRGMPLVVFNSLNWKRSDPVTAKIKFEKSAAENIELTDYKGKSVPFQINDILFFDDGSIKSLNICFIAADVPSIGYKTFYVKSSDKKNGNPEREFKNVFENKFYKIELAGGGLSSIFDKELDKQIIDTRKFNAGEVFTMHSEGTGAGEFADIQQPDMEGFDRAANYPAGWKIDETGEVFTSFINRQPICNAVVEQRIIIYNEIKRIDFRVDLLNYEGVLYREYRMALPLNMENGQVSYEVPFGVVNVGKDEIEGAAGERYLTPCKDIHPRGIENWIGASNEDFGVTLSSSVAVADYIDPTDNPAMNQILQPLLIASRRSCHGDGNEYLQTGDHHFEFSFTSHKPGYENGFRFGRQANEKLLAVVNPPSFSNANLPGEMSFFEVDQDNLIISTIKKAEDDGGFIVRMFDAAGKEVQMKLKGFKPFKSASRTNLIEEIENPLNLKNGEMEFEIGRFSIETFYIK